MKRLVHVILILGVAALLWLMFRKTNWGEVLEAIEGVRIGWLLVATGIVVLSFFLRVQRWSYIVRAAKPVSYRHLFSATQIGFLANFTLPARIGEAVRAVVLARLAHMPFSKCLAMVALDRVTDLVGLLAVILATVLTFQPHDMVIPKETLGFEYHFSAAQVRGGEIFATVFFVLSVLFLVLLYAKQVFVLRLSDKYLGVVSKRLAEYAHDFLENFADALHIFRSASDMAKAVSFSLITWGVCILAFASLMNAFDIQYPWYTPLVMEMLLAVAISVPGPPGFVGQFQVPIIITLVALVPGIDDSKAKAVSIVAHLINLIPVTVVGVFCMVRERFSFVELTHETKIEKSAKASTHEDD